MSRPKHTTSAVGRSVRRRAGFTLLELILAVTVTAVIAVAMFTSLRIAFQTRENAEDRLAGRLTARTTLDRIAADLESVPAPTGRIAGPMIGLDQRMGAAREADALTYYTAAIGLPAEGTIGDLREVELALVDDPLDPDSRMLVRYVSPNPLASTTPEPAVQVLARGVVAFNARYFDGGDWRDEWDSAEQDDTLPNAIELTLTVRPELQDPPEDAFDEDHYLTLVRLVRLPAAPQPDSGSSGSGGGGLFSF